MSEKSGSNTLMVTVLVIFIIFLALFFLYRQPGDDRTVIEIEEKVQETVIPDVSAPTLELNLDGEEGGSQSSEASSGSSRDSGN